MAAGGGRVMVIFGTRPEAIKLAPVLVALEESPHFHPVVVVTGQHRAMLAQVLELFAIAPDHDLGILEPRQTLTSVTTRALAGLDPLLRAERPSAVLVQGDTTTTFAGALAAFYQHVPVFHLEAGLRTGDLDSPYPEEANRQLTSRLASLHLAPTLGNKANLVAEDVDPAASSSRATPSSTRFSRRSSWTRTTATRRSPTSTATRVASSS